MAYTIEKYPNEPILLVTIHEDFKVAVHQELSDNETRLIFDASPEPLFNVVDVTRIKVSFEDVIAAANVGARGHDPIWKHPKIRASVFISPNPLVRIAVTGLSSATFGNIQAKVFASLDEALAWIRAQG